LLPRERLTGLMLENLVPGRGQMILDLTPVDGVLLGFTALPGQTLIGTQQLARLHLTAAPGQQSAFIPIEVSDLLVARAQAGLSPTILLHSGRATVIGTQPLVEATVDEVTGMRWMTLFGIPGRTYRLEQSIGPATDAFWPLWQTITLSNLWQTVDASQSTNAPMIFYRARE